LVFSSYTGREWHNLWVMPAGGGDAFPIAYGDWDQTNARWSPDGREIAFISNRGGGTEICIEPIPGGNAHCMVAPQRSYLQPMGKLHLVLTNSGGDSTAARISVTDTAGKFYAPSGAWIHADDGVDHGQKKFEAHYFHVRGEALIDVPAGPIHVEITRGFERAWDTRAIHAAADEITEVSVSLGQGTWVVPDSGRWVSADVHVHMNYGGAYRNTPDHVVLQAEAENLGQVHTLIVNKEQRFPDIAYNGLHVDQASQPSAVVVHGQEYHTSYWGHLGLLNIDAVILPGYVGYPNTAASSLYPMNADIADMAHERGALVGYVHPFDEEPQPLTKPAEALSNELPVDVALGKVDYMEILGLSDHWSTTRVWYRLLNLGFRIPAAAGTDAMANFASLRGPVGMNRVYVRTSADAAAQGGDATRGNAIRDDASDVANWLSALRQGRSFATNGPLLGFNLGDAKIGDTLKYDTRQFQVHYSVRLQSIVPVDHLELVCNGKVVKSFITRSPLAQGEFSGTINLSSSGWCVVRASTDTARYPILDNYVYATTSPIYVEIAGQAAKSPEDARYFAAWIDRVTESTTAYPDWNNDGEKQGVLDRLQKAKAVYVGMQ
jgi:hypothetical protein